MLVLRLKYTTLYLSLFLNNLLRKRYITIFFQCKQSYHFTINVVKILKIYYITLNINVNQKAEGPKFDPCGIPCNRYIIIFVSILIYTMHEFTTKKKTIKI